MSSQIQHENPGITLEWMKHDHPDVVIVKADGYSYTVVPAEGSMTGGEIDACQKLARPNRDLDGATVRIAKVHDRLLAKHNGFQGSIAYFARIEALRGDKNPLNVGDYYPLETLGWGTPAETQEPRDPRFYTIFIDAFRMMENGTERGEIIVKGFVETTNASYDDDGGFTFVENTIMPSAERRGSNGAIWTKFGMDNEDSFKNNPLPGACLPTENGFNVFYHADHYTPLKVAENLLDNYRMHPMKAVRIECIVEMVKSLPDQVRQQPLPQSLIDELKYEQSHDYAGEMRI